MECATRTQPNFKANPQLERQPHNGAVHSPGGIVRLNTGSPDGGPSPDFFRSAFPHLHVVHAFRHLIVTFFLLTLLSPWILKYTRLAAVRYGLQRRKYGEGQGLRNCAKSATLFSNILFIPSSNIHGEPAKRARYHHSRF